MSKGRNTTTTTTDPQQMEMYADLYNRAKGIADTPFIPYTGARIAGFNPDQLAGFDATRNMFGQSMGFDPRGQLNRLANQQAPSLLSTDLEAYQNPFQQQVIDSTLNDLNRARQIQLQSDQDRAIGAGAFGGSRSAILESETNRNFADQAARAAGNLRMQGFDRATSLAGQDLGREMQNRGFQAGLFGNQLSDQYRALGLLSGIGSQQQGLQQGALDSSFGEFMRALQYPQQQLNMLSQGISALPTQSQVTQSYKPGFGDYLGGAAGLLGSAFVGGLNPFGFLRL